MEIKNMPIPDYYKERPNSEYVLRIMMAKDFFREVLNILFYSDDDYMRVYKEEALIINAEMFSEYCEHIRVLYQAYFENAKRDKSEIMYMLRAYDYLAKIAAFTELIFEDERDVICEIANFAVNAILNIGDFEESHPTINWETAMCDVTRNGIWVWYDFEKDTPQDVWNRFCVHALPD